MIVLGCLGTGSFGKVYKIQFCQRIFALKKIQLKFGYYDDADIAKQQAQNQAKILQDCPPHPNIVRYFHSYEKRDSFYILMEYAGDSNLSDLEFPLQNQKQIINFIIQICIGLLHLKRQRIIHRDLKPSNIIVSSKGLLKIADFGVSKQMAAHKLASTRLGTPFYTAPEIVLQKKYDFSVDVWSFGVILYEVCHGLLPFRGTTISELKENITQNEPYIKTSLHRDIQLIIQGCLKKNPPQRLTVEEILAHPSVQAQMHQEIQGTHRYF